MIQQDTRPSRTPNASEMWLYYCEGIVNSSEWSDARIMTTQANVNSRETMIKLPQPAWIKFIFFASMRCVLKYLPTAVMSAEKPKPMKVNPMGLEMPSSAQSSGASPWSLGNRNLRRMVNPGKLAALLKVRKAPCLLNVYREQPVCRRV